MINRRLTHFVTTLFRTKPVQCTQALHDNSISFTPLKTHGLSAYPAVKKNVMYFFYISHRIKLLPSVGFDI